MDRVCGFARGMQLDCRDRAGENLASNDARLVASKASTRRAVVHCGDGDPWDLQFRFYGCHDLWLDRSWDADGVVF